MPRPTAADAASVAIIGVAMRTAIAASRKPPRAPIAWAKCASGCSFRLDPVIVAQGWASHPSCEFSRVAFPPRRRLLSTRLADKPSMAGRTAPPPSTDLSTAVDNPAPKRRARRR